MPRHLLPAMSAIILLGFWSCFSKKPAKPSLEEWIDQTFAGEIRYLQAVVDLDPKRLFNHKKPILLVDGKDSLVQLFATAITSDPDFGLNPEKLRAALLIRREEKRQAEGLYTDLAAAGLGDISVAVVEGHCYIMVFAEPTRENREAIAPKIMAVMRGQQSVEPVRLWVEWMEPEALRQETGPVVPYGYWKRGDSYHDRQTVMKGGLDWHGDVTADDLRATWAYNTGSARMTRYLDTAYDEVLAWAKGGRARPTDIRRNRAAIWIDEKNPFLVRFAFPYHDGQPQDQADEPMGYIAGVYDPETHTFTDIRLKDSL